VNSLPKTITRQRRGCDLNPGPTAPESSTLTTRLPSHPSEDAEGDVAHLWSSDHHADGCARLAMCDFILAFVSDLMPMWIRYKNVGTLVPNENIKKNVVTVLSK